MHEVVDLPGEEYQLKLTTKRLISGRCQVKFSASVTSQKELYGYVLVEADHKLKEVVGNIREKLNLIKSNKDFQHIHLYSIGKNRQADMSFMIFDRAN